MSIERTFNIYCDRCLEMQGSPYNAQARLTPTDLREQLADAGWRRIGSQDYCNKCAPIIAKQRGEG